MAAAQQSSTAPAVGGLKRGASKRNSINAPSAKRARLSTTAESPADGEEGSAATSVPPEETPETAPKPLKLPTKVSDYRPIPTLPERQATDLPDDIYQSIAASGVFAASLQRSRLRWVSEGLFDRYWVKPETGKHAKPPPPNNPEAKWMKHKGPCRIRVEPHVLEAEIYLEEKVKPAPPPKYSASPAAAAGQSPYGQPFRPQSHAQQFAQRQQVPATPAHAGPQTTPYQTPLPPPQQQQRQHVAPAATSQQSTPVPPPDKKASPDPVIAMLAARASSDPVLKGLMKEVATGHASQEHLRSFQRYIDELTAIIQKQRQDEEAQPAAAARAATPVQNTGTIRYNGPTAPPARPSPQPQVQVTAPGAAPANGVAPVTGSTQSPAVPPLGQAQTQAQPPIPTPSQPPVPMNTQAPAQNAPAPQPAVAPVAPAPQTPQARAPPPQAYQHPQQPPAPAPIQYQTPPAPRPPPQYAPPKPWVPPPPAALPVIIAFTTAGATEDRFLFPQHSILESLSPQHTLASFIVTRKGRDAADPTGLAPDTEYWQPVTVMVEVAYGREELLNCLRRWVAPAEQARAHMAAVMARCTRAPEAFLALRLPFPGAEMAETEEEAASKEILPRAPEEKPKKERKPYVRKDKAAAAAAAAAAGGADPAKKAGEGAAAGPASKIPGTGVITPTSAGAAAAGATATSPAPANGAPAPAPVPAAGVAPAGGVVAAPVPGSVAGGQAAPAAVAPVPAAQAPAPVTVDASKAETSASAPQTSAEPAGETKPASATPAATDVVMTE